MKRKYALLLITGIIISFTIFQTACRKIDLSATAGPGRSERFFQTTSSNEKLLRIIQRLKDEDSRSGFVNKLPLKAGFPVWEKMVRQQNGTENRDGEDSTGNLIIPLTTNDKNLSSLLIVAERPDGTLITTCFTTNDYLYWTTHSTTIDTLQATYDLNTFFYMENHTFGTTRFYHIPAALFPDNTSLDDNGEKMVEIKDDTTNNGNIVPTVWICVEYLHLCPICNQYPCSEGYSYYYTVCTPVGGGGGGNPFPLPPTGGNTPPPHGGGGGGGNNPPPNPPNPPPPTGPPVPPPVPIPPDCMWNGWYGKIVLPGDGCVPTTPPSPPVPNPCDTMMAQLQNDATFRHYFKWLNTTGPQFPLGQSYETGFIVKRSTGSYDIKYGQVNSPFIYWNPVPSGIDGILHSHYQGYNSIFSPHDIVLMAQIYLKGLAKDTTSLFFGVTSTYGQPMMMKVTNTAVFRAFAEKIVGPTGDDYIKRNAFLDKYKNRFNDRDNADTNVKEFLQMLRSEGVLAGLGLYMGNAACNLWSKLNIDSNDGVSSTNCY